MEEVQAGVRRRGLAAIGQLTESEMSRRQGYQTLGVYDACACSGLMTPGLGRTDNMGGALLQHGGWPLFSGPGRQDYAPRTTLCEVDSYGFSETQGYSSSSAELRPEGACLGLLQASQTRYLALRSQPYAALRGAGAGLEG